MANTDGTPVGRSEPETADVLTTQGGMLDRGQEFAAFMSSDGERLGRIALLLCGDRSRAEDLVQEALVRTYIAWPRARATDPFSYARRILVNHRVDTWRRQRREVLMGSSDLYDRPQSGHETIIVNHEIVLKALLTLSPKRRRIVVLRYFVGLSEREVAEELSIPLGTVKSSTKRALVDLGVFLDGTVQH